MTYEETAKALRLCGSDDESACQKCPRQAKCSEDKNMGGLLRDSADAIEKLSKRVPKVPHGRLIDADALMKQVEHDAPLSTVYEKTMRQHLNNAPTIIPAEEAATKEIDATTKPYDLLYEEGGLGIR